MQELRLRLRADLREALDERDVATFSVGPAGEALVLAAREADVTAALEKVSNAGGARFPISRTKRGYEALALRHTGKSWESALLRDVILGCPLIQFLPSGEWLVVGMRCEVFSDGSHESNAHVFSDDGDRVREFFLGDGIEDVQVSARGDLWVSYFDEGVFGNEGVDPPMGGAGLSRFDLDGKKLWDFVPPSGVGTIADCYALNVTDRYAWAYYYTDFPLVRIEAGSNVVRAWQADLSGSHAFAVDGQRVLFAGQYHHPWTHATAMEFAEAALGMPVAASMVKPNGEAFTKHARVVGRGDELHVLDEGVWYSVRLADVPTSASAPPPERRIVEQFQIPHVSRGGMVLVAARDAEAFLVACETMGARLLGIEGFRIVDGETVPDMGLILDLTMGGVNPSAPEALRAARRFLRDHVPSDVLLDFTLAQT